MKKQTTESYSRAINLNADTNFPYFVRHARNGMFSKGDVGFGVLHWHEDLQLIYVIEGVACVTTLGEKKLVSAGEGIFVNKGVIHYSVERSNPCEYILLRFPEKMLTFYTGSPAEKITRTVTDNSNITVVVFTEDISWCRQVLQLLQKLVRLDEENNDNKESLLYMYEVQIYLCRIWMAMLENLDITVESNENITGKRMRRMLEYIERSYAESVTLEDIAESAGISKSEALRCFHQSLQTTPYNYLMNYRLLKAVNLLEETNSPVGEVMWRCGFRQQSYFGKCFKEKTGCSPREYRKKCRG